MPGMRSKEGDESIAPATRAAQNNPWPSVVVEVGYRETLAQLRIDAEWWLKNSGGQAKFVILLSVSRNPNRLAIEAWSMLPPDCRGRYTPPLISRNGQGFDIDVVGTVTTTLNQLTIPYSNIFNDPHASSTDLIFTTAELSAFALWLFSQWVRV